MIMLSEKQYKVMVGEHRLIERWGCGAVSLPIPHKHYGDPHNAPAPLRVMRCSEELGHEGPHKDAICCWHFEKFTADQVDHLEPMDRRMCSCGKLWGACETARVLQGVLDVD